MIRRRFNVFRGVGERLERAIWHAGISDWGVFSSTAERGGAAGRAAKLVEAQLPAWQEALARRDARFFADRLAGSEHWHLYDAFGDAVRYLDIETTGFYGGAEAVTVVGVSDGRRYEALVAGRNLTQRRLAELLDGCKLLVTYYGRVFDVPFLARAFGGIDWRLPNFDLCFAGRKLDLTGGLKQVEKKLGIVRAGEIEGMDGFEAVRLWYEYIRGSNAALERLIEYNRADTENLPRIAPVIYRGLCDRLVTDCRRAAAH